ncbi:MAG TPA: LysR substrate-binding domain-containing protein [Labilithrix sp.]|nr:LysR substrate-binding domain-containing protein [Labilithrix sp.]
MSLREDREAEHVRVRVLGSTRDPIDVALKKHGIVRDVVLTVPHFSLAPLVVLRTGCITTLSARLARLYAGLLPLAVRKPPIALEPRPVYMLWHDRTDLDPGARFFRQLVIDTAVL